MNTKLFQRGYLVCAHEAGPEGSQELDERRAAVAADGVVGPHAGHAASPANALPHNHAQIGHKERALLGLSDKLEKLL